MITAENVGTKIPLIYMFKAKILKICNKGSNSFQSRKCRIFSVYFANNFGLFFYQNSSIVLFAIFLEIILRLIMMSLFSERANRTVSESLSVNNTGVVMQGKNKVLTDELKKSIKSVIVVSIWFGMHMMITGRIMSATDFSLNEVVWSPLSLVSGN
jgi:hypothetical protein